MIKNLEGFLKIILDVNTNLQSLELVNCSDKLYLSAGFFVDYLKACNSLKKLNLSKNNLSLNDKEALVGFLKAAV